MAFLLTMPAVWAEEGEEALMKKAVAAYQSKDYKKSKSMLEEIIQRFPDSSEAYYFLGDLHLQEKQISQAVHYWRQYVKMDFAGAAAQGVPKKLTLLEDEVRKDEFQKLLENEDKISKSPPEPNTVAVFPMSNSGDDKYSVLGKGLTALIIADLAKIPGIKVLERQHLSKLMEEIQLSKTGLVEKDSKVRASRLLKAERLVMGDFTVREK
ncbi:MAG: tetratricopeptide repeat protein [Magnetococcales bacterium]|nr:tetratricopeptide repeat protein [Magnetococcales bacterium]